MTDRIESLDSLKAICIFLVVLLHLNDKVSSTGIMIIPDFLAVNTTRLAVPVFFLTSGYIVSKKIQSAGPRYCLKYCKNILKYYVYGTGIYLVLTLSVLYLNGFLRTGSVSSSIEIDLFGVDGLISLLYSGDAVAYHLWFLPALIFSISAATLAVKHERLRELGMAGLTVFVAGTLLNSYNLGPTVSPQDPLFRGLAFITTGFILQRGERLQEIYSKKLLILSGLVFYAERVVISFFIGEGLFWGEVSLATYPFSTAVLIYFLKHPVKLSDTRLALYGRQTVWTYILHVIPVSVIIGAGRLSGIGIEDNLPFSIVSAICIYVFLMEAESRDTASKIYQKLSNRDPFKRIRRL